MNENSIYRFESGLIESGDLKYYLILTHSFKENILSATHLIKIIQYSNKKEFNVDFEISSGSPIWKESVEVRLDIKKMVIKDIFDFEGML